MSNQITADDVRAAREHARKSEEAFELARKASDDTSRGFVPKFRPHLAKLELVSLEARIARAEIELAFNRCAPDLEVLRAWLIEEVELARAVYAKAERPTPPTPLDTINAKALAMQLQARLDFAAALTAKGAATEARARLTTAMAIVYESHERLCRDREAAGLPYPTSIVTAPFGLSTRFLVPASVRECARLVQEIERQRVDDGREHLHINSDRARLEELHNEFAEHEAAERLLSEREMTPRERAVRDAESTWRENEAIHESGLTRDEYAAREKQRQRAAPTPDPTPAE